MISAVAKSSRKMKSRLRGRLELFNMADLELTRGKDLDIINQAEIIHNFLNISQNFYKFVFAGIISNIILKTQISGDENPQLFKLLYVCLNEIDFTEEEDELALKKILCFFDSKFLQLTGYEPMMGACSRCNKDPGDLYVMQKYDVYFSISYGGVLCRDCAGNTGAKTKLNTSTFRLLSDLYKLKIEELRDIELDSNNLKKAYKLLEAYLVFHTNCTLDSFKYLKKINL